MLEAALDKYKAANGGSSVGFSGITVIADIDHGYELGDTLPWASWLKLWKLEAPLDPEQPTLPELITSGPGFTWNPDQGSSLYWDDYLTYDFQAKGTYFVEVTAWWPYNSNGVPEGADYELHMSIQEHFEDTFLFAPEALPEDENGNNSTGSAQDLDPRNPGDPSVDPGVNFFTFYDPTVGNADHAGGAIDFTTPYVRIEGSGNGSVDIFEFDVTEDMFNTDAGDLGTVTEDAGPFFTNVVFKLNGTVAAGDIWRLGLGYRDYATHCGRRFGRSAGHCQQFQDPDRSCP